MNPKLHTLARLDFQAIRLNQIYLIEFGDVLTPELLQRKYMIECAGLSIGERESLNQ